jgi:hypothetical protein
MCPHDVDTKAELDKLPKLLREKGWSSSEVKEKYANTEPGSWLQGSSGPTETHSGITLFTGTAFQVIAREDDLKVRVGWPGQFTTTYTCYSAEQVVWWLGKILELADKDYEERKRNRNLL